MKFIKGAGEEDHQPLPGWGQSHAAFNGVVAFPVDMHKPTEGNPVEGDLGAFPFANLGQAGGDSQSRTPPQGCRRPGTQ